MTSIVLVGDTPLTVVGHPRYAEAHPEEADDGSECEQCLVAVRRDTNEEVLLWCCGGITYSVSRHDPNYPRHRRDLQGI